MLGLLALTACGLGRREYGQTFDDDGSWELGAVQGVRGAVVDGRLLVTLDYPQARFWSVAGRSDLADGVFEVEGGVVDGSPQAAFGLVLRADPAAANFHFVAVSGDGAYSIGFCRNRCDKPEEFLRSTTPAWIPSSAVQTGLGAVNQLRVEALGKQLRVQINGVEATVIDDPNLLLNGDVGLFAETFDAGATLAFDNLRFAPAAP